MHSHSKLSWAIAAILGGGSAHELAAGDADASSSADQIQEITVTAQR